MLTQTCEGMAKRATKKAPAKGGAKKVSPSVASSEPLKVYRPDMQVTFIRSMFGIVITIGVLLIFTVPFLIAGSLISIIGTLVIGCGVAAVVLLPTVLHLLNMHYTRYKVAEDGVHFHEGFFTRRQKFLPFKRVTDVNIVQHWPIDTWFGTGQIMLETAGIGSALRLINIARPTQAYELLKEMTLKAK